MTESGKPETQLQLAIGSLLTLLSVLSIVYTMIAHPFQDGAWYAFPLGFITGLAGGFGVTLVIHNLIVIRNR